MKDFKSKNGFFTGNVGIGTTSPDEMLHLEGAEPIIKLTDTTTNLSASLDANNSRGSLLCIADSTNDGTDAFISFRIGGRSIGYQKMIIDYDGNVGIGTASPDGLLELRKGSGSTGYNHLRLITSAGGGLQIGALSDDANPTWSINTNSNEPIVFSSGTNEYMRIESGNIGIGTTDPSTGISSDVTMLQIEDNNLPLLKLTHSVGGSLEVYRNGSGDTQFDHDEVTKLTISSGGNVGIGTTNPANLLHVQRNTTSDAYAVIENTTAGNAGINIKNTSGDWSIIANADLRFIDNAVGAGDRMRIDSDGNVGIGTTNPKHELHIYNSTSAPRIRLQCANSSNAAILFGDITDDTEAGILWDAGEEKLFIRGYNNTDRITIDNLGNVGIGTTNPGAKLFIKGDQTNDAYISISADNSVGEKDAGIFFNATRGVNNAGSNAEIKVTHDGGSGLGKMLFATRRGSGVPTTAMIIDSNGNVVIGTTDITPYDNNSNTATDNGVVITDTGRIYGATYGNSCAIFNRTLNNGGIVEFRRSGTSVGSISVTTSATAYNTSSDYRLKTDVQPMTGAIERLKALKPVNFEWIADGTRVDGFLAHEAQEVVPEAVTGTKDAMQTEEYEVTPAVYEDIIIPAVDEVVDEDGNVITEAQEERTEQKLVSEAVISEREVPDYQGIDQSKLVPLLTAAIQEQQQIIEDLKSRIETLES